MTKKQSLQGITRPVISSKKVANSTFKINYADSSTAYRLHSTDVITFYANSVTLNSGGWRTVTTKDRINQFLPHGWYVSQNKGIWSVRTNAGVFDFYDGITFDSTTGEPDKVKHTDVKKVEAMKLKIKKFVSKVDKLKEIPYPSAGDCWDCSLRTQDGETMGDIKGDNEHLLSHLKEGYLHGSLILNALRYSGYRDEQFPYVIKIKAIVKRALTKYLRKKLIKELAT